MKKLALALVCLVSVAFFASCDQIQNPSPTVSVLNEDNCIQDGAVINQDETYPFGFKVASSAESGVELAQLVITVNDEGVDTVDLTGKTEYTYKAEITINSQQRDSIVDHGCIKAVVTDAKNYTGTASINYSVNQVSYLEVAPFEWRRDNGSDGSGMEEFGLQWTKNINGKTVAKIEPLEGATLIDFSSNPEIWANTNTAIQKAALFTENTIGMASFNGVSTTASSDYDYVLGTIYNGETHLIHITHCNVYERGWHFVITGEAK